MSHPPGVPSPPDPTGNSSAKASFASSTTCNLYINSLPKEVTDDKLVQIFGTFGDIESARVMVDLTTKVSKGYGFVKFRNNEAAQNAIQAMNGFQMGSNTLTVKAANENVTGTTSSNNIYIKGLPVIVTPDQLRQECAKYGNITELRILADFATGISRGQALVRFDDTASATYAIEQMDNRPFPIPGNVKNLIVKYADSEEEKVDRKAKIKKKIAAARYNPYQSAPPAYPTPVYPPYYAYTPSPELQALPYPPATFTYTQPLSLDSSGGLPNVPPPVPAYATVAPSSSSSLDPYGNGPAIVAAPRRPPAPPVSYDSSQDPNVYVYHLPPETDDAHLYQRFGKYGAILSIKIARDPNGICKGYGFIRFSGMQSAIGAIEGENGQRVGNKVLSVSLAKQKGGY